jgi:ABC-type glycerol-3-phosphate transport system permease component
MASAMIAASILSLVTALEIYERDGSNSTLFSLYVIAISFIWLAGVIIKLFNDRSNLRIARAIQIEKNLRIYSFRLFPPYQEFPKGYLSTLGRYLCNNQIVGTDDIELQYMDFGRKKYKEITEQRRVSQILRIVRNSTAIAIIISIIYIIAASLLL